MSPRRKRGAASADAEGPVSEVDAQSTPQRSKKAKTSTPLTATPSQPSKLLVKDLQSLLAERGLDTRGRKADLIARLEQYDQEHRDDVTVEQDADIVKEDVVIDEEMQLSPSKRSASPSKARRSLSPTKSPSPKKIERSPSKAQRSPSPQKIKPSPLKARRSPSPKKVQPSPSKARRSPSPKKAQPSPSKARRSPSPKKVQPSPSKTRRSPSPKKIQPSPSKTRRSPSPKKIQPSPSKVRRSPSPKKVPSTAQRSPTPTKSPLERSPLPSTPKRSPSPMKDERSPPPLKAQQLVSPRKAIEIEQRVSPSPHRPLSLSPSASPDRRPKHSRSRSPSPESQRRSRSSSSESDREAVMEVPGSPPGATFAIRIDNFVRPLRIDDVRHLVSKYGDITDLFMDKFKTHAIVKYESRAQAATALRALQGISFQAESGKTLSVTFVSNPPSPMTASGGSSVAAASPLLPMELGEGIPPPATDTLTLDHIFKKTTTLPPLYWIPNTNA